MAENKPSLSDKFWRMNHLYRVVNKDGNSVPFRLNEIQTAVFHGLHNRNIILKARQVGLSTLAVLYLMDEAIFTRHLPCGIVSYSLEHGQHIFRRIIGHAIDTFPSDLRPYLGIEQRSAREISFSNGSYIRVDTSLRGGTYLFTVVSEYGKTCARNPLKAEEVMTGTIQSVPINGRIIVESTGEGSDGYFFDMVTTCHQSDQSDQANLSPLQYKLFFFPWYQEPNYTTNMPVTMGIELLDYFSSIEKEANITLTQGQKNWYAHQKSILGDKIGQEYPSTIKEAFLSSSEAYYFASLIEQAANTSRMLSISPYDPLAPVYIAMDIGVNDMTVITFLQVVHGEIRIIDYYEGNGKGVDHYCHHLLYEKKYIYHTIFLPHDSAKRDGIIVENSYEREFRKLFSHTSTRVIVLKRTDKNINISNAKIKLSRCVFNINRVKPLVEQLQKYRKKWSEQFGKYLDEPYHDTSSNYADSFIYAMQAVTHIEAAGTSSGALEAHKQVTSSRHLRI